MDLQVSNRAERMGLTNAQDNLYLYSATQLSDVLREITQMKPRAVIVDSIQTVYLEYVTGSAGSISQVRKPLQPRFHDHMHMKLPMKMCKPPYLRSTD